MYKSIVASGLTMMALETSAIKITVEGQLSEVEALMDAKLAQLKQEDYGAEEAPAEESVAIAPVEEGVAEEASAEATEDAAEETSDLLEESGITPEDAVVAVITGAFEEVLADGVVEPHEEEALGLVLDELGAPEEAKAEILGILTETGEAIEEAAVVAFIEEGGLTEEEIVVAVLGGAFEEILADGVVEPTEEEALDQLLDQMGAPEEAKLEILGVLADTAAEIDEIIEATNDVVEAEVEAAVEEFTDELAEELGAAVEEAIVETVTELYEEILEDGVVTEEEAEVFVAVLEEFGISEALQEEGVEVAEDAAEEITEEAEEAYLEDAEEAILEEAFYEAV